MGAGISQCGVEEDVSLEEVNMQQLEGEFTMDYVKKIDEVRSYLENGYELVLSKNSDTAKVTGSLMFWKNSRSLEEVHEVDVDEFIECFDHIRDILDNGICYVQYNFDTLKIVNSIKHRVYHGPYDEDVSYEVVGDLEVESGDVFSSFVYQDRKIKTYLENVDKKFIKKKEI